MSMVRELAFELAQLRREQRDELLAELPVEQRTLIVSLMDEIEAQLSGSIRVQTQFEQHLQTAEAEAARPFVHLNDGQVRLLLGAEHPAVQHRIAGSVRRSHMNEFAPTVASVVSTYFARRLESTEIGSGAQPRRALGFWRKLLRVER